MDGLGTLVFLRKLSRELKARDEIPLAQAILDLTHDTNFNPSNPEARIAEVIANRMDSLRHDIAQAITGID